MTLVGDAELTGGQEPLANSVTAARAHCRAYLPSPFRAQACSTHQANPIYPEIRPQHSAATPHHPFSN